MHRYSAITSFIGAQGDGAPEAPQQGSNASPDWDGDIIAGMGTVHMVQLSGKMAEAMEAAPNTAFALVANVAVQPGLRGRGVGRALLNSCEQRARETFRPTPRALLLVAYRSNTSAMALYESVGFKDCTRWVDPAWLEDAEKGRLGNERRRLLYKEIEVPQS